jgi:HK97 family phage major capsid protein
MLTGATATWGGEAQTITDSAPTFGFVELNLKELVIEVIMPNKLLRNSNANLEKKIRDDMELAARLKIDLAGLRGTGGKTSGNTGVEPLGLRYTTGVTVTALGTNGRIPTPKDYTDGWGRIEDSNVESSPSWGAIMSPRSRRTIMNTTDTTGQLIPSERFDQGHNVFPTTQVPNTLTVGSSTDCSEVYLGEWNYLVIGRGMDVEFKTDESIYVRQRQTLIQGVAYVDVAVAHTDAFQILSGVRA